MHFWLHNIGKNTPLSIIEEDELVDGRHVRAAPKYESEVVELALEGETVRTTVSCPRVSKLIACVIPINPLALILFISLYALSLFLFLLRLASTKKMSVINDAFLLSVCIQLQKSHLVPILFYDSLSLSLSLSHSPFISLLNA